MDNMDLTAAEATHERTSKRLKLVMGLLMLTMLAACGGYYYAWQQARIAAWRHGENATPYMTLRDRFLAHVVAGEHDQAYALTSQRFRQEVSKVRFVELAKRHIELHQQPDGQHQGESEGQSGPPSGDPSGLAHQYMEFRRQYRYRDGKLITITQQIRRGPDSLLMLEPPEFQVDVWTIEEKPAEQK